MSNESCELAKKGSNEGCELAKKGSNEGCELAKKGSNEGCELAVRTARGYATEDASLWLGYRCENMLASTSVFVKVRHRKLKDWLGTSKNKEI